MWMKRCSVICMQRDAGFLNEINEKQAESDEI